MPLAFWREQLAAMQMPAHVLAHLTTMAQLHQANRYDRFSDDVERLTGVAPMSLLAFVQAHAEAFAPTAR